MAAWSSGMILASGASGHGFDSRSGPWNFEHENDESSNVARVAQSAEHGSYEPRVAGSSPAMSTYFSVRFFSSDTEQHTK